MNDHHEHNFINKHTSFAVLLLIVGCFLAGYFVGTHSIYRNNGFYGNGMMSGWYQNDNRSNW